MSHQKDERYCAECQKPYLRSQADKHRREEGHWPHEYPSIKAGVKKGTNDARHVEHPGFKRVQAHIAAQEDPRHPGHKIGQERAGAILAARSRNASAAAKRRNPDLKKVNT